MSGKNADKKARTFNLDELFQQTKIRLQEENKLRELTKQTLNDKDDDGEDEEQEMEKSNSKINKYICKNDTVIQNMAKPDDGEVIGPLPPVKNDSSKLDDDGEEDDGEENEEKEEEKIPKGRFYELIFHFFCSENSIEFCLIVPLAKLTNYPVKR